MLIKRESDPLNPRFILEDAALDVKFLSSKVELAVEMSGEYFPFSVDRPLASFLSPIQVKPFAGLFV